MKKAFPVRAEITEDEYLAAELLAEEKHEFVAGLVYAMAGASEAHNIIAANLAGLLYNALRGKPCQPFGSDMKARVRALNANSYYYPDAMIACDSSDGGHGWRERPTVLFEIISENTRHIDEREKRLSYLQLPSLEAYVRIEQTHVEVAVDRRTPDGWKPEHLRGLDAVLSLPEPGVALALADLYERLTLPS